MLDPDEQRAMNMHVFELLDEGELADLVGVTMDTLQRWRVQGTGPAYVKLGKSVFYHRSQVKAWIAESAVEPTPALPFGLTPTLE